MVTAAGSSTFPIRYRGLGTTVVLATLDIGQLIGAPLAGILLHVSGSLGMPGYATMYLVMSAVLVLVAGLYAAKLRPVPVPRAPARQSTLPAVQVAGGYPPAEALLREALRRHPPTHRLAPASPPTASAGRS